MEVNNDVVNHLLFHKALIDEDNDSSHINKYLTMAQTMPEPSSIDNVFDRSVYLIFDLVVNQDFDPWDIDLVNFSSLYLARAKQEKIDLMVAGRIIYMAWKILRLQSDHLVVTMEEQQQQPLDPGFGWEDIPMSTWMASDQELLHEPVDEDAGAAPDRAAPSGCHTKSHAHGVAAGFRRGTKGGRTAPDARRSSP